MNLSLYRPTPQTELPLEMTNGSLPVPPLHSQRGPVQHYDTEISPPTRPDNGLWLNERPVGVESTPAGVYSATSYTGHGPPANVEYYASCTTGYDDPPCRAPGFVEHYRGARIIDHSGPQAPAWPAQYVSDFPIAPGPAQVEYYAPPLPICGMPNDGTIGRGPPLNLAGTSHGTPGMMSPRMPTSEDLKCLASRYLYGPNARVEKVRLRHSRRSSKVKVMILLEIDDMI